MDAQDGAKQWLPTDAILRGDAPPAYLPLRDFPSVQRYRSWRFLGGGAFGRVFAGVHGDLGRIEAIKRMEIADDRLRHMALEEARTMARLPPHPHLVTLYNVEERERAIYMMLQCIDGKPLDGLQLPVPVNQALAWTRDTAEALALVHAYGVVHRDIKPGNIFCTTHEDGVLGDFGVARATDAGSRIAAIAGTPAYMAPEAFVGRATPASDLWSLGVMLYELLTGRRPFPQCEGLPIDQAPRALSEAHLEFPSTIQPGIPSRIDDLVLMLLAPRAENRLGSAMAVLDLLPRYDTVVSAINGDITQLDVDAIALSANERLAMNVPGSVANAARITIASAGTELRRKGMARARRSLPRVSATTGSRSSTGSATASLPKPSCVTKLSAALTSSSRFSTRSAPSRSAL